MHAVAIVSVIGIQVAVVVDVEGVIGAYIYIRGYPIFLFIILSVFILSYLKQFL